MADTDGIYKTSIMISLFHSLWTRGIRLLVSILFIVCILFVCDKPAFTAQSDIAAFLRQQNFYAKKHILLLYSFGYGFTSYNKINQALLENTLNAGISTNNMYFEYLDLQRNTTEEYHRHLAAFLKSKYADKKIDLIITLNEPAFSFLLKELDDFSPTAPVISILHAESVNLSHTHRDILRIPFSLDYKGTLEQALKLFPRTENVIFVAGVGQEDIRRTGEARKIYSPWNRRINFTYTNQLTFREILKMVTRLPANTVIIYCSMYTDTSGKTYVPRDVANAIARRANAPVFGLYDSLDGTDVIGGSMMSYFDEGTRLSHLVKRVLNGEVKIKGKKSLQQSNTIPLYNYIQLQHWKINPKQLPYGTKYTNFTPTYWDQYWIYIVGVLAFCILQTIWLILLTIQKHMRKNTEIQLRESEEQYRLLVEHAPDAILVYDADESKFIDANSNALKLFGCSRETLLTGGPERFYISQQPDGLPVMESIKSKVSKTLSGETLIFERYIHNAEGEDLICEVRLLKLPSRIRNLLRASYVDITERRKAEHALQESQRTLSTLMSNLPGLAYRCKNDENWTMMFVSDGCLELTGYPSEALLENAVLSYTDMIHPEDRQAVWDGVQKGLDSKQPFRLTYRIITIDGVEKWVWEQGRGIYSDDGELIALEGLAIDITDRVVAEDACRRSEERYRRLYESMMDGYVAVDKNDKIIEHNDAFQNMIGYDDSEIKDLTYRQLTPEKWYEKEQLIIDNEVMTQGYSNTYEKEYIRKDGTVFPVELRTYLEHDGAGKPVNTWALVRDITDRKRVEDEKRQFYRNTIKSVTDGKLDIVSLDTVLAYIDNSELKVPFTTPEELTEARDKAAEYCNKYLYRSERCGLFITATGEAMTNALKHANAGQVFFNKSDDELWVGVSDSGPGIATLTLPSATLGRGYSTKVSMGMGYTIMLDVSDHIMLCTGPAGTTVILFINLHKDIRSLSLNDLPDTWGTISTSGQS